MGCSNSKAKKPKVPVTNPYAKIHKQREKDVDEVAKVPSLEDITIPDVLKSSAEEFQIGSYLQEGGMGKVYSAVRISDGKKVALKFFGYTKRLATPSDIQHEIDLMAALKGVEGFIQAEGVFWDTVEGIVPSAKLHPVACPVIVMELMEGGELFDRMHALKEVSEKYIARIFKSIVTALDSMHKKGFVHRDFKLENAMMVNMDRDSPVRIIDFGMVCKTNAQGIHRGAAIQGTPGYIAPESITYHTYSAKTDLWQAGCTLYSLLSGLLPYNRDDYEQVTHHKYYPMKGVGWDSISAEAKDLVRQILTRRPESRINAEDILKHPWIVSEAPDTQMGVDYFARIKQLALRQKLKCFFLDSRLEERNQVRRNQLQRLLPFLSASSSSPPTPADKSSSLSSSVTHPSNLSLRSADTASSSGAAVAAPGSRVEALRYLNSTPSSSGSLDKEGGEHIQSKLKQLKDIIIPSLASTFTGDELVDEDITKDMTPQQKVLSRRITTRDNVVDNEEKTAPDTEAMSGAGANSIDHGQDSNSNGYDATGHFTPITTPTKPRTTQPVLKKASSSSSGGNRIDYDTFDAMMVECGLPELASPSVFKIFDLNHCGYIDLKDFLLTMIAFREDPDEPAPPAASPPGAGSSVNRKMLRRRDSMASSEEAVRLYFNVFDYKETGYIDKEELRTVVACILQDQAESDLENNMGSLSFNVEDLFDIIDVKKNGVIDYEEFKQFYEAVLTNTNTRRSIVLDDLSSPPLTTN